MKISLVVVLTFVSTIGMFSYMFLFSCLFQILPISQGKKRIPKRLCLQTWMYARYLIQTRSELPDFLIGNMPSRSKLMPE